MLDRSHINNILKLNGVDPQAPDDEIKSILLSARWHEKDVETALLVLRENSVTHEMHVDTLRKIFKDDEQLKPETISALLGIDVEVKKDQLSQTAFEKSLGISFGQIMQIAMVSISFSILFFIVSMWYMHVGLFHITMQ